MIRQLMVVWIAFVMVWYAVNVPAEQLKLTRESSRGNISESAIRTPNLVGGFPWKYCEYIDNEPYAGGLTEKRRYVSWSSANLLWNIAVGFSIAGILGFLILRSGRPQKKALPEASDVGTNKQKGGLQVSLAGLLIAITVLAVFLGVYRHGKQRLFEDLNAFGRSGGRCTATLSAPRWLASVVDMGFAMRIQVGSLDCKQCSDADFRLISKMRSLETLTVSGASSEEICTLAALPNLKSIALNDFELTDSIRNALAANAGIASFSFDFQPTNTPPSNSQLQHLFEALAKRPGTRRLSLTAMSEQTLTVQNVPGLDSLTIRPQDPTGSQPIGMNPPATDADVSVILADLPDLIHLSLMAPMVSLTIKNAPKLEGLALDSAGVRQRLALQDLTSLAAIQFGRQFPKILDWKNLPALVSKPDDRVGGQFSSRFSVLGIRGSGITMRSTLTASAAEALGEHASALVLPYQLTVPGLATVLPRIKLTELDMSQLGIVEDEAGKFDFDSLPEMEGIVSLKATPPIWIESEPSDNHHSEILGLLKKTPNLRELWIGNEFTDAEMPLLSRLTKLEILVAQDSPVTDDGWKLRPDMHSLRHLTIPKGLSQVDLQDLPKLESLHYDHAGIRSLRIKNLPALKIGLDIDDKLKSVSISKIGEVEYIRLRSLPNDIELLDTPIRAIQIDDESFTDEHLAKIVSPATERLLLGHTRITNASLELLLGLKQLKLLEISATGFTESDVKRLVAETNLEHLVANQIEMSEDTLKSLPHQHPLSWSSLRPPG